MGEVVEFPKQEEIKLEQDPYYRFIHNVLTTADSCGFELPFTIDSAAEHVYKSTKDTSQLAKLLKD